MLSREKTVYWVGMTFLESQQDLVDGLCIPDMIEGWKNLLPEIWREHATLNVLKVTSLLLADLYCNCLTVANRTGIRTCRKTESSLMKEHVK